MRSKPYYTDLIDALRETLAALEQMKLADVNDPALVELKSAIVRVLAEKQVKEHIPELA